MAELDADVIAKVRQWAALADEDLRWSQHGFTLTGGDPYRLIAYHAQQCAEKYLKAFLVLKGVDFPYTHNIARLLELCAEQGDWAARLDDAAELTPYAISSRYPADDDEVTDAEARRAVELAERVRDVVSKALSDEGVAPA